MSDIKFDYPKDEPSMICTRSFDAPRGAGLEGVHRPGACRPLVGPEIHRAGQDDRQARAAARRHSGASSASGRTAARQIVFTGKYLDVVTREEAGQHFGVEGQFEGDEAFPETHTFEERDGTHLLPLVLAAAELRGARRGRRHRHGKGRPRVDGTARRAGRRAREGDRAEMFAGRPHRGQQDPGHHPHPQCAARAGVEDVLGSLSPRAMVGPEGLHQPRREARLPHRRQLAARDDRAGRQGTADRQRHPRGHASPSGSSTATRRPTRRSSATTRRRASPRR